MVEGGSKMDSKPYVLIKRIRENRLEDSLTLEEAEIKNQEGVREYNEGNYEEAYDLFLEAAQNGDAWGMYNFADLLKEVAKDEDGNITDEDAMMEAFRWFKKSAQKGNADAMFDLGICYSRGEGTEEDAVMAFAWCKKAAENGVINAMNWVGGFYDSGSGVLMDKKKALTWYEKSGEGGNEYAAFNAAYMYDKGSESIPKNKSKAIYWYKKAADAGHEIAMNNLGYMYQVGEGVKADDCLAAEWYIKAIKSGNETAKNNFKNLMNGLSEQRRASILKEVGINSMSDAKKLGL